MHFIEMLHKQAMKSEMVTNESMGILEQLEHKYLLAVEGVDKASSTQWIMMSGSVLVMPPSWLLEGRLAPWVHYVRTKPAQNQAKSIFFFTS